MAGFFGSLVDGPRSDRKYKAHLGDKPWDCSSVSDGLVGAGAAPAAFAFSESLFANGP